MKLYINILISALIISCSSLNLDYMDIVNEIIMKPERYKEIIKDSLNVNQNYKYTESFEAQLFRVKNNGLSLVEEEDFIYDGDKQVCKSFYDPIEKELISLTFVFYKTNSDRWKLDYMFYILTKK